MASVVQDNFRIRSSFGKIDSQIKLPNLIEIQKRSYDKFLQLGVDPMEREDIGLQAVFRRVFPIKDFNESASLDFVKYEIDAPKYDVDECHSRGMTYAAPMKVSIRLIVWEKDEVTGQQSIRSVKEQDVYFGEIPLMTDHGTFIVNGTERVIVS
ncbi:MAG: DNA-directed RNA polymerase subunit beta, partial [Myxococcota bacterium]